MDRWLSSTCAYQGWAGGFGINKVIKIAADSLERVWPDLTVVLDVDLQTAAERMQRDLDRMEQKGDAYHAKVREGFLKLPKIHSSIKVVDARQSIENVHQDVLKLIQGL
ncbi:MAG: dTMP kinase, partial [Planctomycetota bacterium]|jgi:dTMP kinase